MPENDSTAKKKKLPAALIFILFVIVLLAVSFAVIKMLQGTEPAAAEQPEETIPETEKRLDKTIVIDAGHGGIDCGALGIKTKVREDILNLDVAKKLKALLLESGASVIMTRESEDAIGKSKDLDMQKRKEIISDSNADIVLSIHMNFFSDSSSSGPQVFYYEGSKEGMTLARHIQLKMNDILKPRSPRIHMKGNYFILRSGEAPAVIVECGFLSNAGEELLLNDEAYRQKVAQSIFEGILSYVNNPEYAGQTN